MQTGKTCWLEKIEYVYISSLSESVLFLFFVNQSLFPGYNKAKCNKTEN